MPQRRPHQRQHLERFPAQLTPHTLPSAPSRSHLRSVCSSCRSNQVQRVHAGESASVHTKQNPESSPEAHIVGQDGAEAVGVAQPHGALVQEFDALTLVGPQVPAFTERRLRCSGAQLMWACAVQACQRCATPLFSAHPICLNTVFAMCQQAAA